MSQSSQKIVLNNTAESIEYNSVQPLSFQSNLIAIAKSLTSS